MDNIPVHLRITGLTVTNEDVDSRRKAVTELAATWAKFTDVAAIFSKAGEIAELLSGSGQPPNGLASEVEAAVQKHASAFLSADKPLEVGICAGMAIVAVLRPEPGIGGWTTADVYSNALWSALSYRSPLQDEKREALRLEVLNRARERSLMSANRAREREPVPEMGDVTITTAEDGKTTSNVKKTVAAVVDPMRRNSALDREELDFLWWVQLGRSRLLKKQFSSVSEPVRLVASGIEGASYLRRLPADAHRDIVLRTLDADPKLDLTELLEAIGDDRAAMISALSSDGITAARPVFPLLNTLLAGVAVGDDAAVKRTASQWGARALLEASLDSMRHSGVKKL